ncbi:cytochrome protein [Macrophomina phaseolina]|uniref:Cytochrome protein n=1 Tax=Macrophomina phaseolina TaxID=35725 RepID=A0ABQ8G6M4_9PEZI|nr:cytochrome protein [Macrophomina phaseolina]
METKHHTFFQGLATPMSIQQILGTAVAIILAFGTYYYLNAERPYPGIPLVLAEGGVEEARKAFRNNAVKMIGTALKQVNGVCQIWTDGGPKILLPTKFVDEIRNNKKLSFIEILRNVILFHFPPSKVTEALSVETALTLDKYYPPSKEPFYPIAVDVVSRLSPRVFLGEKLCRDPDWIRVSGDYTVTLFTAIQALRKYPRFLQPFMYRLGLVPEIKPQKIIEEELARQEGLGPENVESNSLQWVASMAAQKKITGYNPVWAQLALTLAAIHTTSMAFTNTLFDLVAHPDLIDELRQEIVIVIGTQGWQKTSLNHLRLMDSVLKESQRLNPPDAYSMRRKVMESVTLSDGTVLPKGSHFVLPPVVLRDERLYGPDPDVYDGRRWYRMRQQPGNETKFQYVTTTPDLHEFGHGEHACPGRFFASNELKIAVVHAIMKCDWAFEEGKNRPETVLQVDLMMPDPTVKLRYRSRQPEIEL